MSPPRTSRLHTHSEGNSILRGVEIFAAGNHRGKPYSRQDLDDMVANFRRFSTGKKPLLEVPGVAGHEEDQSFLERSDIPAMAWCKSIYRHGDTLKADFDDIPPKVARVLRERRYKHVSAEVYDEPPEGVPGKGKMLRRVAFLGGDIPQVKTLDDIPLPEPHSERFAFGRIAVVKFHEFHQSAKGCWACFSEVTPMDRQQIIEKLQSMGMDVSSITDAVPDDALASMCQAMEAAKQPVEQHDDDPDKKKPGGVEGESTMGLMNEFDEAMPEDDDGKKSYAEKARKYFEAAKKMAERCGMKLDDAASDTDQPEPPVKPMGEPPMGPKKVTTTQHFTEADVKRIVAEALKEHVGGTVTELKKFHEEQVASAKKLAVESFCEARIASGKLTAAEYKAKAAGGPGGPVYERLIRADSRSVVCKFTEKGQKVEATELDMQMREIDARPTLFREKFKDPQTQTTSEDAEVAKVESHYESFREAFAATNTKKEELVSAFKAKRKRDESLTADRFLNVA